MDCQWQSSIPRLKIVFLDIFEILDQLFIYFNNFGNSVTTLFCTHVFGEFRVRDGQVHVHVLLIDCMLSC